MIQPVLDRVRHHTTYNNPEDWAEEVGRELANIRIDPEAAVEEGEEDEGTAWRVVRDEISGVEGQVRSVAEERGMDEESLFDSIEEGFRERYREIVSEAEGE